MIELNIEEAEKFVDEQQALGNRVWWDGWSIIMYRPDGRAMYSERGVLRDGTVGFETVIEPSPQGTWKVGFDNVQVF